MYQLIKPARNTAATPRVVAGVSQLLLYTQGKNGFGDELVACSRSVIAATLQ